MDVFVMIRRKKSTIFLTARENTTIQELAAMVEGITKIAPENQLFYKGGEVMEPNKILADYGINYSTAKPQEPFTLGLVYRNSETHDFEELEITPLSVPPELPEVLRSSERQNNA